MDSSERQVRRLLWEAKMLLSDPRHPINDRRHPKHREALAAMRMIEDQGRRLLAGQAARPAECRQ